MTQKTVIKVTDLTKVYKLYEKPIDRLKEVLNPTRKNYHKDFLALDQLNFQIESGQSIGIIGKNGSGKSTLLKILTGVTTPTSGTVEVTGKIAALLELGAGFNPELTGVENVFLSGAMSGYSNDEMSHKLEDILSFADIGEFINQPVKMYSSGMFARLAFSVAVNVDPDILIVDEALSVGDLRFQQKCIRKMKEFSDTNKTVIFVTHDLNIVTNFCDKTIWIDAGKMREYDSSNNVANHYLSYMAYELETSKKNEPVTSKMLESEWNPVNSSESFGLGGAKVIGYRVLNSENEKVLGSICGGEFIKIRLKVQVFSKIEKPGVGILFKDRYGTAIFGVGNYIYHKVFNTWTDGIYIIDVQFKFPYLANGDYLASVALSDGTQFIHEQHDWIHDLLHINISSDDIKQKIGNIFAINDDINFACERVD